MDKTYCIIHTPNCRVTFEGVDAEKYAEIWDEIKNKKYNKRMSLINYFEEKLSIVQAELKTLKDDRTFWQKLCGIKTETSKRIAELQNEVCCILDDIFELKADMDYTPNELLRKVYSLLDAESFNDVENGKTIQVWTKTYK